MVKEDTRILLQTAEFVEIDDITDDFTNNELTFAMDDISLIIEALILEAYNRVVLILYEDTVLPISVELCVIV